MLTEQTKTEIIHLEAQFIVRPATMDDIDGIIAMSNISGRKMIGTNDMNADELRTEYSNPKVDLESSVRVVTTQSGMIIGAIEVWDIMNPPVEIWVWARVHPDFEGMGIGSMLMQWAEERARQNVDRIPADLKITMRSGTYHGYRPAEQLLLDQDMHYIRSFWTMVIDLEKEAVPPPALPKGIVIRPMNGLDELEATVRAFDESFRDHWGHVEQPFEETMTEWQHVAKTDPNFDPALWFLAMDGNEIAGISLCWPKAHIDPEMGWVGTLGMRRQWRRRGIALALLHHSFREFKMRGMKKVGLGVDAASLTGATRLYEKAGMKMLRQFDSYEKILRPGRDISTQSLE